MRWPNRDPHALTPGMRRAQRAMSGFLPLVDWLRFRRRPLNGLVGVDDPEVVAFACGDAGQAVVWLLRTVVAADGRVDRTAAGVRIEVPGLANGECGVTAWNTARGEVCWRGRAVAAAGTAVVDVPPFEADVALAIAAHRR